LEKLITFILEKNQEKDLKREEIKEEIKGRNKRRR